MIDSHKNLLYRLGLLALLVVAVYGTTLNHGFVWDDNSIIVNNPVLEELRNIPRMFLTEDTIEAPTGYYRPVTYISFALDRAAWGTNPLGYHAVNLILQLLVVLLFYRVVSVLFANERLALVAALVFALHPVAGETINFIAGGRNTLLCALFALLSFYFHISKKRLPALVCFTLAIFSKEFALLLPCIMLVHDRLMEREQFRMRRYLPYFVPIICFLTLRSFAVQKANFFSSVNIKDAAFAPYLVMRYVLNMIFPFNLKVLYPIEFDMIAWIVSSVLLLAMMGAMFHFRRQKGILFAVFWFFLFLLPVINIIPLHTTTMLADRYAYFALMGFALFLGMLMSTITNVRITATAVVILCAVYSFIDISRNGFWKNNIAFFTRMTQDAPQRFDGFKNLGMSYYNKGDVANAMRYLELADSSPTIPFSYLVGNAYIYWKENMPDNAEQSLFRALKLQPYNPEPYLMLMLLSQQKGNLDAARQYRETLRGLVIDIDMILRERVVSLCRMGETHISRKMYADAEVVLWQALQINPDYIPALIDMGSLKAETGKPEQAVEYLTRAIDLDPINAPAHYNLSMVYQMQGKVAEARQEMVLFREAEAASSQQTVSTQ